LRDAMTRGQEKINENAKDVQWGVPSTPFEAEDYEDALLPLINYLARIGQQNIGKEKPPERKPISSSASIVLIALDNSPN
ncbi:hypothetical protein ACC734_39775, partial [Rhizobium ruizarguesonis]